MSTQITRGGASALSRRETVVLNYLQQTVSDTICPSFQEIADSTGLKSKSQVSETLAGLRHKGWIKADPFRARSIELTDPFSGKSTEELRAMRDRIDRVLAGRAA